MKAASRPVPCLTVVTLAAVLFVTACSTISQYKAEQDFDSGLALFNQGRYEEAAPYFQKAADADPRSGRAYLYLGRCYLNLGRFADAVQPLRAALELSPDDMQNEIFNLVLDAMMGGHPRP